MSIALFAVIIGASILLIGVGLAARRAGGQDLVQAPRDDAAATMRKRRLLLILAILVLAGAGIAIGLLAPRDHSGNPINTVTSRP